MKVTNTNFQEQIHLVVKGVVLMVALVLSTVVNPLVVFANGSDGEECSTPVNIEGVAQSAAPGMMAPHDAAVISIDSPQYFCPGVHPIIVTIQNAGTQPLTSVTVNWSLNGIPMFPVNWNGNLSPVGGGGPNTAQVTVGSNNFVAGPVWTIGAWTTMPNGMVDPITSNDSVQVMRSAAIQGTYTVGGVTPDFATINDAVTFVENNGLCGPVVFNIRSGTYNEQVTIGEIDGASSNYTVTFQSETGNKSDVTITFSAISSLDNHTIRLDGGSHVIFQNLTLEATGSTLRRVIEVQGSSSNCQFIGNDIISSNSTSTSTNYATIYSGGDVNDGMEFRDNHIQGGSYGLYFNGQSTSLLEQDVIIQNNVIEPYYRGIHVEYQEGIHVSGNTISSNTFSSSISFTGIYARNIGIGSSLMGNILDVPDGQYGFYIGDLNGSLTDPVLVANNFIHVGGNSNATGMFIVGSNGIVDVAFNSVNITATFTLNEAIGYNGTATDLRVQNNIFNNSGGGYAAYYSSINGLAANYNNYYTTGAILNNYQNSDYTDLQGYQVGSSQDANSYDWDPKFVSNTDLHTAVGGLNGGATPVSGVNVDIDNDPRDPNFPDIGADEFTPPPVDMSVAEILKPTTGCGLSDIEPVKIVLRNFGSQPVTVGQMMDVSFVINQQPTVTETITLTQQIDPVDTLHYLFNNVADLSASGSYDVTAWVTISGDAGPSNDTASSTAFNSLINNFPHIERFENWGPESTLGSCGSQDGVALFGWLNDLADDGVWNVNSGSSPTGGTGPVIDYLPGTAAGKYLYIESSGCNNVTISIISPCIDMAGISNPGMNMAYHMDGSTIGTLFLDVIMEDGTEFPAIWKVVGEQGTDWNLAAVDLTNFAALGNFRIRFRAETDGSAGDIAIDDIRFGSLPTANIAVDTIRDCGFTRVAAPVGDQLSYKWSTGETDRVIQVSNPGNTVVTSDVGLQISKGGMYNVDTVVVVLDPGPVLDLGEELLFCDTNSITLDAGNAGSTYQWDNGNFTQTRTVTSDGEYWVQVNDGQGCVKRDTVIVDLDDTPVADFAYYNVSGRSFIEFSKASSEGDEFTWDFGDGNGATVEEPTHYYTSGGTYTVTLIVSSGCGSDTTSQIIEVWFTGIEDIDGLNNVNVFPNPASTYVEISLEAENPTSWMINLMDVQGKMVLSKQTVRIANATERINVSNLSPGYYLIEMQSDLGRIVRPVVVK